MPNRGRSFDMAGRASKKQVQLIVLAVLVAAIVGVLIYIVSSGPELPAPSYAAKRIDAAVSEEVFEHPVYRRLQPSVSLPLDPGPMGRPNPFRPYGDGGAQ